MKAFYILLHYIGILLSLIYPKIISSYAKSIANRIYTGYLYRRFKRFGNSVIMYKSFHLEGLDYVEVGDGCIFEQDLQLTAWKEKSIPTIKIGNNCLLRKGCHITAVNSITIGNDVLFGNNVIITDNSHGSIDAESIKTPPREREIVSKGKIIIGDNVWFGNNVCVMSGVTIGNNSIIGANSVVTHSVPENSVACGSPATIIKHF